MMEKWESLQQPGLRGHRLASVWRPPQLLTHTSTGSSENITNFKS